MLHFAEWKAMGKPYIIIVFSIEFIKQYIYNKAG